MKIAAIFPGQGSQQIGMGRDLYENFRVAREVFEEASDAISVNLKKLCFEGPEADLTLTENTQPTLLTVSVAAFQVLQAEREFAPEVVAGHSLGEYSALVCAGSLELATAVRWVRARGQAMQLAVPQGQGGMAVILNLEDAKISVLCADALQIAQEKRDHGETPEIEVALTLEPANFNAPGQVAISGSKDAIDEAIKLVSSDPQGTFKGAKALPLPVSAPFHCSLMEPAKEKMAQIFSKDSPLHTPRALLIPYVPNVTARVNQEHSLILEFLTAQVTHPVLWKQTITGLLETGFDIFVECGSGRVLSGLTKRIAPKGLRPEQAPKLISVGDTESLKEGLRTLSKND
ncbi:ACP S-malonyltransferase [Bdellovibrionota bacterium FG-2]